VCVVLFKCLTVIHTQKRRRYDTTPTFPSTHAFDPYPHDSSARMGTSDFVGVTVKFTWTFGIHNLHEFCVRKWSGDRTLHEPSSFRTDAQDSSSNPSQSSTLLQHYYWSLTKSFAWTQTDPPPLTFRPAPTPAPTGSLRRRSSRAGRAGLDWTAAPFRG
jgi:hypothetical protein